MQHTIRLQGSRLFPLLVLFVFLFLASTPTFALCSISSIPNFRRVGISTVHYRSGTLDQLSLEDAKVLLGYDLTIIDLRNQDEISKGQNQHSDGAKWFYEQLEKNRNWLHIPILQNVNAFWDEAIDRLPLGQRLAATAQTVFQAGALDHAAAGALQKGGLVALYTVMLTTCQTPLRKALEVCAEISEGEPNEMKRPPRVILFHCQKGKDRTGLLAMLLQHCMGDHPQEIVHAYQQTQHFLNESLSSKSSEQTGLVDWSYFRGSPQEAMADTMTWVDATYGSLDGYLDAIGFHERKRVRFLET